MREIGMGWISRIIAVSVFAGLAVAGATGGVSAKTDQPVYTVVSEEDDFEIRDYEAIVVAQYTMRGSYSRAVNQGYIELERYFLGANSVPEPISRTVPVMVRDDLEAGWTTFFVLPSSYRQSTAPAPKDARIRIIEYPARRVAVVRFKGKINENAMREQVARLDAWLASRGIAHRGDFLLAGYEEVWKPKRMRGNEIIVTLK
jgi:DNA gyrase inhibitor GyrI